MRNSFNTYVQVDKNLFDDIQKMKAEQEAIPHYTAQTVELGDLKKQSKCEIMRKMKHNLEEIEKQYKNEDSKGWIGTCGYTAFAKKEKYVFPAFDYLFNLKKLSRFINHLVEIRCTNYFDKYIKGDKYDRRNLPIHHFIHFIDDFRQECLWAIRDSSNITNMQLLVSFNVEDFGETRRKWYSENNNNEKVLIPNSVNFLASHDDEKFYLKACSNCRGNNERVDSFVTSGAWWSKNELSTKMFKLSEWEKGFIETFKVTNEELKELNNHNNKYKS